MVAGRTSSTPLLLPAIRMRPLEVVQRSSLLLAWIIVVAIFSGLLPSEYPTTDNFSSIFGSQAFVAVLALGLIVVLRVGDFDLSVAATMTMGSVVLAVLDVNHGFSPAEAAVVALLVGAGIGLANGVLVVGFGVDSFIATLGVATILQGAALWVTHQETIVGVSQVFVSAIVLDRFLGIPLEFYYALAVMVVLTYFFRFTVLGRRFLFVGKNREVARLSGIDVSRIKIGAFVITGFLSAGAGILLTGTSGSADPTSGLSYLLPVYAAAFLGATTTTNGEFTAIGTVVAVFFLVSGITGLAIAGVEVFVQQIFYGGALILAVSASRLLRRRRVPRRAAAAQEAAG
jgi:ribose transport system permease protein